MRHAALPVLLVLGLLSAGGGLERSDGRSSTGYINGSLSGTCTLAESSGTLAGSFQWQASAVTAAGKRMTFPPLSGQVTGTLSAGRVDGILDFGTEQTTFQATEGPP